MTTPNSIITPQTIGTPVRCLLSTAMTNTKAYDGTDTAGTALNTFYTAGASGDIIDGIRVSFTSTDGATVSGTSSATVVRFWLNNGSANTTASNNIILPFELAIPATTVTALATTALPSYFITSYLPKIPANWKLYAGTTVAVGGTNIALMVGIVSAGAL